MSAAYTVRGEPAAPNGRCASLPSSRREKKAPQCSSWTMSPGASRVKTSIESWSPMKSDPLTVSYAWISGSSSEAFPSAALMPPSAAPECERVGWSFEIIATSAPASKASIAARMPAHPAPTTGTSCFAITELTLAHGKGTTPGEPFPVDARDAADRFLASPTLSDATRRAYGLDAGDFCTWLEDRGTSLDAADVRVLADYVAWLGGAR